MVSQVSLDHATCIGTGNVGNKDGNFSVPLPSQEHAAPQMPVKKQTRQWAAWTRQEEESFFAALRQVGKNFEKITCHVQSKNKDQVRHYYYRLVRRMNKLLGPEVYLDAKNSKDTNAAMLRWWSLLEKYSCKASKLHLKPRRFKIFVDTLENQLLKDQKKNIKRRLSTGENISSVTHIPASNKVRAPADNNRAVKMVLVDSQNIQRPGSGKGSMLKRHVNMGPTRTNWKIDTASVKTAKHRRKAGLVSSAAYKKWEKAAIAGVSLVADAAEQLERVDTDKEIKHVQEKTGQDGSQLVGNVVHSFPSSSQLFNDNNFPNSTKLKLQLFPIDECTRQALEMDNHNPHLELTLSTRKKISSVVEHLNRKWGNSLLLSRELMLFPYWAQKENLVGYQKWTKDSPLCAADVYYLIGSPPIFRLRYGWLSKAEIESGSAQSLSCTVSSDHNFSITTAAEQNAQTQNPSNLLNDKLISAEQVNTLTSSTSAPNNAVEHEDLAATRQIETPEGIPVAEWADSLTNISVGDLLSESMQNMDANCTEFPTPLVSNNLQQIPFSCDSFDAAIAAHIYKHKNKVDLQEGAASLAPSIWNSEETCDAFAFHKNDALFDKRQNAFRNDSLEACKQIAMAGPSAHQVQELPEVENLTDNTSTCEDPVDDCSYDHPSGNSTEDFVALTDVYWPDSLGPLDLDIPSCRYQSNDLTLSDSLGGLNRLIANSLDAFQSCSFFGLDKKESASTAEARQPASFADLKIGSEV